MPNDRNTYFAPYAANQLRSAGWQILKFDDAGFTIRFGRTLRKVPYKDSSVLSVCALQTKSLIQEAIAKRTI